MFLTFLTLLVAVCISAVSAYYSILGLVSIFAAAAMPVIIMGGVLEAGKLMAALWLHKNWKRANLQFKLYLVPAILFLMVLTSMGVFGFLSKAHLDQAVPTGNVAGQIELIDTKIATQRENINAARKNLKQLDDAVDQVLARSTSEQGASRSSQLRKTQVKDRADISAQIETAQKSIAQLNEEKVKVNQELRKVEAEVGPIKYVAALIYGDNPNADLLERAVRWVIILIVSVFDPLAVVLLLAGDQQWQWVKADRIARRQEKDQPANDDKLIAELNEMIGKFQEENTELYDENDRLKAELESAKSLANAVSWTTTTTLAEPELETESTVALDETPENDNATLSEYELNLNNFRRLRSVLAEADNVIKFGTEWPDGPIKGQMFLITSTVPTKLYKFNAEKWIEVDKSLSDQYVYNLSYIDYLMDKIASGEYDPELLTEAERSQIEQRLIN